MGKEIDPSDIGKYPEIIKKAQSEIGTMDVLVCGNCNNVFHFVEQFREHKGTRCTKSVQQKDNLETRPVIWSFLLWKAAQLNHDQNKDPNHSHGWRLYQTWMKLDEAIKETWVVAGRTIQSFAKVGQGSLQEMPVKITKTVVGNQPEQSRGRQLINNRLVAKPPPPSAKELNDSFNALKDSDKRPMVRTIPAKPTINNRTVNPVGILARKALRTVGTNASGNAQAIEHNIEKILAKRFNPRQREHEYLIKWENLGHERNTWEPASHLEKVPVILDTFEKQLALQKEKRLAVAKQAQQQQQMANAKTSSKDDSSQSEDDTGASSVKRRRVDTSIGVASGGVAGVTMRKVVRNEPTHLVQQVKTNGLPAAPVQTKKGNDKSADVVITDAKDGKPTGIVKKSGVTPNTRSKNEAQIKFIPKGGDSVSGVVRVANAATPTTSPANRVMQKMGSTTVKPVQGVQRSTVTKAKLAEMERAASVQHLAVANEVKPTITRVVKSAPNSKNVTPEQKIAALTRQGNLKITRKTVCGQTSQAQPILIQDAGDDFSISDSFGMNVVAATATTPTPKVEGSQTQIHIDQHDQDLLGQVLGHVTNDGNIALVSTKQNYIFQPKTTKSTDSNFLLAAAARTTAIARRQPIATARHRDRSEWHSTNIGIER